MDLISTVTVGAGGASTIDFTSIPGTYTDLVLVSSLRDTTSGSGDGGISIRFNGDSGANYTRRLLGGTGSGVASTSASSATSISNGGYGGNPNAGTTANTFGNSIIVIPNYLGSTVKTMSMDAVGENNATAANSSILAGLWNNTAAITSITFLASTSYVQNSTVSLYGVLKGSGGATVS